MRCVRDCGIGVDDIMCDDIKCEDLHLASVAGIDDITCDDPHLSSVVGMDDITCDNRTYDDLNQKCVRLWY